jgi:hypothetical protein
MIKNIVKSLRYAGHDDLAEIVTAQQENGDMPQHDQGRISEPKSSQPEGADDQFQSDYHSNIEVEDEKEQKNLYSVNINCTMSFNIEIQAKDESEAINISPSYAIDTLNEIKDILNKNFRSFNISFNKIAAKEAKEVIVEAANSSE